MSRSGTVVSDVVRAASPFAAPLRRPRRGSAARAASEVLAGLPSSVLLLSAGAADPEVAGVARALGVPMVRLPDLPGAPGRIVGLAVRWASDGHHDVCRLVEALVSGMVCRGNRGPSSRSVELLQTVRPDVLARWARRAWTGCAWCGGGGVISGVCARCGVPIGQGNA